MTNGFNYCWSNAGAIVLKMLNRVLCIVQCWNISIVTSIKLFQSTSCNLLKNKIAHSLLSNGFFTELNRTLLEQNVNNYLKPSHLLSWFHATQEYATQYTLNPRLIETHYSHSSVSFWGSGRVFSDPGFDPKYIAKLGKTRNFLNRMRGLTATREAEFAKVLALDDL